MADRDPCEYGAGRRVVDFSTLLLIVALPLALVFVPAYLKENFLPAGAIGGGQLDGGNADSAPPILALFYWFLATVVPTVLQSRRRLGAEGRVIFPVRGWLGWVSLVVTLCLAGAYVYALPSHWVATDAQIVVRRDMFAPSKTHAWSEVTARVLSCSAGRGGRHASLYLNLADRENLGLSDLYFDEFGQYVARVALLTPSARQVDATGDRRGCPDFVAGLLGPS